MTEDKKIKIPFWMGVHLFLAMMSIPITLIIWSSSNDEMMTGIIFLLWFGTGLLSFVNKWIATLYENLTALFIIVMLVCSGITSASVIATVTHEEFEKTGVLLEVEIPGRFSRCDAYFDDGTFVSISNGYYNAKARLLPYVGMNITIRYSKVTSIYTLDEIILNEEAVP